MGKLLKIILLKYSLFIFPKQFLIYNSTFSSNIFSFFTLNLILIGNTYNKRVNENEESKIVEIDENLSFCRKYNTGRRQQQTGQFDEIARIAQNIFVERVYKRNTSIIHYVIERKFSVRKYIFNDKLRLYEINQYISIGF